jgi:hypothetical protein
MKHNPTELDYEALRPGEGPRYGVTTSPSEDWKTAARTTFAWFVSSQDAERFRKDTLCHIWDLENAKRLT